MAYTQQHRAYLNENVSRPKPKHRILIDLANFITTWRGHNKTPSVIVMMDANTDTTDPHFYTLIADTSLRNVVSHHFPKNIKAHTQMEKRIDIY